MEQEGDIGFKYVVLNVMLICLLFILAGCGTEQY